MEFHDNLDPTMAVAVAEICKSLRNRGFWVVKGDGPGNEDVLFLACRETVGVRDLLQVVLALGLTSVRSVLK